MTNDATRASDTLLPEISRRNFLLHTAAVGAAMTIATPTIASEHPDADLFSLEKEMKIANVRLKRAYRRCAQIDRKVQKAVGEGPPHPWGWKQPDMPDDVREAFSSMTVREMRDGKHPALYNSWMEAMKEAKAQVEATRDDFSKMKKVQYELHGYEAAETVADSLHDDLWRIGRRIFATQATTFEGMMVKVRAGDRLELEAYADANEAFLSIIKDIKRLSKGGAA